MEPRNILQKADIKYSEKLNIYFAKELVVITEVRISVQDF